MIQGHINALEHKHADLEHRIEAEAARPSPDLTTLHDLKKRKLALKDQIEVYRHN